MQKDSSQVQGNAANHGGGNFWSRSRGESHGDGHGGVVESHTMGEGRTPNSVHGSVGGRASGRGGGHGVTWFNCGQIGHYATSCQNRLNNGAIGGR